MGNPLSNRRFSPTLPALMLTLVGIGAFVALGFWQLDRAAGKRALAAQFEAGRQSTLALSAADAGELSRYQHVEARGRYDAQHQVLLDNMPSQHGRPGYRVLTPFQLTGGEWILVDRGWVPLGQTRAQLPEVAVPEDERAIAGRLDRLPQPGIRLDQPEPPLDGPWPRVLGFPEHSTLQRLLQRPLLPPIVLLDAEQPDGYERAWQARFEVGPNRHVGYAVQWFAFALAAAIIFVVISLKPRTQ